MVFASGPAEDQCHALVRQSVRNGVNHVVREAVDKDVLFLPSFNFVPLLSTIVPRGVPLASDGA